MQSSEAAIKIYKHPPIVEATIEIRSSVLLTREDQKKIVTKLKSEYPDVKEINEVEFEFSSIDNDERLKNKNPTVKPKGFRLSSNDQANISMLLNQSIVISRLAPYPGWDSFCKKAMIVWKKWKQVQKNIPISRIGVRYINRIDVPINSGSNTINIADYLTIFPENTIYNEEPLSNYFIHLTKHTPFENWFVNITSTVQKPAPLIDTVSLLLDIDVYYQRDEFFFKKDDDLINLLKEARRIKNDIFQQTITDKTEEFFNK